MRLSKALITGITGQDGAYLAESLLSDGFHVTGQMKSCQSKSLWRLEKLGILNHPNLHLIDLEITNPGAIFAYIEDQKPTEVYNLASHSFVGDSRRATYETAQVTSMAPINIMEGIKRHSPQTRFFQAGSSEIFGNTTKSPQTEDSPLNPRNIYGAAKTFAHAAVTNFRENDGLFCSTGIFYNHESPLRGLAFLTRKVTNTVARIQHGLTKTLSLGNMSAIRDWGYAPDYVRAARAMMSSTKPDSFVVATGVATSVRDFTQMAFASVGIELLFSGEGMNEAGYEAKSGRELVRVDPDFFRPIELVPLVGDPSKAQLQLGWRAEVPVADLVRVMVEDDLSQLERELKG
jgi:GDPmannose 4,6-dehydratase